MGAKLGGVRSDERVRPSKMISERSGGRDIFFCLRQRATFRKKGVGHSVMHILCGTGKLPYIHSRAQQLSGHKKPWNGAQERERDDKSARGLRVGPHTKKEGKKRTSYFPIPSDAACAHTHVKKNASQKQAPNDRRFLGGLRLVHPQ